MKIPKPEDTERFMTWEEIERRIARGGLSDDQQKELWKYLFLDEIQIKELLKHVEKKAAHAFIYPMIAFVSYSGVRRSTNIRNCPQRSSWVCRKSFSASASRENRRR